MENLDFPFNYWESKGSHRLLVLDVFVKDFEISNHARIEKLGGINMTIILPQSHNSIFSLLQEVIPSGIFRAESIM